MQEVRRVQKFGRSTLMISLPSEWVKSVGLSPGDTVSIEVLEDGTLRLAPLTMLGKRKERVLRIKVSKGSSEELLIRAIYAAYLLGSDRVEVTAIDNVLSESHLKTIRETVKSLIGMEIIEHMPGKVVIQILIDASKYSASAIIGRMANLVRFMIQHIQASIIDKTPHLLNEVLELEYEVDRLYALTVRQLLLSQTNKTLSKYLGIKPSLVTEYRSIVKAFEEAADALSQIAELLIEKGWVVITKVSAKEELLKECIDTLLLIIDRAHKCLTAMNPYLVNEVLNLITEYYNHIRKYNEIIFKELGLDETYLAIRDIIDKFNYVSRAMENVTEVAFDIALEKTGEELDISRAYL
jgi:phosphate uptake regulator